jgi:hypothetical protein
MRGDQRTRKKAKLLRKGVWLRSLGLRRPQSKEIQIVASSLPS